MRKFKRAQKQNQASIEKHLEANVISSSSSEDENEEILETAVEKVLSKYEYEGGDPNKTLSYLTDTFQSGGAICLICISSVKKIDAIWSCTKCYVFLHLSCIQHWIRDSLSYKHEKGITPLWGCPKCRTEYEENQIPRKYNCFCGKIEDPPYQPWLIPHSCGNICAKFLQPKCGHTCMLLCHPGPCPPCPKMVSITCFCEKQVPRPQRCNAKEWRSCNCQNKAELKRCDESFWRCTKICGRYYSCNIHICEEVCHKLGDCNACPLEYNRTCPCGKKKYAISCKQPQIPTCGDTCGKLLDCKAHYCNMRCHPDQCGQCLEVVTKTCRCGSFNKEMACIKEFYCNKKCTQMRLCGRHLCNKKCCDCLIKNNFNVCEKVCDNTLNCRKHKCLAPCHSGPCYPCPRTIVIQCRCGHSKITVPCGTVKKIKPPHCNKKCKILPICHHPKRETHKCHQGACPPCRKVCGLIHKMCGHTCPALCHTKVWTKIMPSITKPAGPWEIEKERWEFKSFPCPPCEISVMVTCLGGHETSPWPCHKAIPSSCLRQCNQLLSCTNHYCEKLCHKLSDASDDENKCMECEKSCLFPRPKGCTHICPKLCHPAPCPTCKQLVKVSCHCGINTLYIRCNELNSATTEKRNELLKCGNQCPRMYLCGHRCMDNCHIGECQKAELCDKKVKVLCKCKRIKKYFSCLLIRTGKAIVKCDDVCQKKKEELDRIREIEQEKKQKEEKMKNQREIEMFEKKFKSTRRRKDRHQNTEELNNNGCSYNWIWIFSILLVGISVAVMFTFQIENLS